MVNQAKCTVIYKKPGETPLEAIGRLRKSRSEFSDQIISYAGRLDPMAEGVLLLLIGEENKKRKEYEKLPKTYQAEVVLGISTDSFDGLGLVVKINTTSLVNAEKIQKELKKMIGEVAQSYPPYSSRTVKGKALYWWARNNRLSEINVPQKKVRIYTIEGIEIDEINGKKIVEFLVPRIVSVRGDFRQEEIIVGWNRFEGAYGEANFIKVKFEVTVSSGTYVRALANDIGGKLGTGGFLMRLTRTKVGAYTRDDCVIIKE